MALVIGSTPTPDPPLLSDTPLELTLSASGALHPNWVGENGSTFSSHNRLIARHVSPTTFYPPAQTGTTTVKGYRVKWVTDAGVLIDNANAGIFAPNPGAVIRYAGAGTAWDSGMLFGGITGTIGFVECRPKDVNTSKFFGYSAGYTGMYGALPSDVNIRFIWEFLPNGAAQPRRDGVVIGNPVVASPNDVFKIEVTASGATYLKNDVVQATTGVGTGGGANPVFCMLENGTGFEDIIFYDDDAVTPLKRGLLVFDTIGVFPVQPNYSYDTSVDNKTLVSYAEDGSATLRRKGRATKRTLSLNFNSRPFSEFQQLYDFWMHHQKDIPFYYKDLVYGTIYTMVHDSGLKYQASGPDQISVSVVLREV